MGFWIKHPRTGEPDTMLTAAIAGFLLSTGIVAVSLTAAIIYKNASYLTSIAAIVGAIIVPTVSAYTARKYTDSKNGNNITTSKDGE